VSCEAVDDEGAAGTAGCPWFFPTNTGLSVSPNGSAPRVPDEGGTTTAVLDSLAIAPGKAGVVGAAGSDGTAGGELAESPNESVAVGAESVFLGAGADGFNSSKLSASDFGGALGAAAALAESGGAGCESEAAAFFAAGAGDVASAKSNASTCPLESLVVV